MPFEIKVLGAEDAGLVARALAGTFDNAPRPNLTAAFLADPRHHFVAAIDADRVVGFASAVHYVHPDKPTELWINEVGVAPPYQRQGVGRALLGALLAHAKGLGCKAAWVLTEETNAAALRLYSTSGGVRAPKSVVMFDFDLSGDTS